MDGEQITELTPLERIGRVQLSRSEQTAFEKARVKLRQLLRPFFKSEDEPQSEYSQAMEEYSEPGV